MQSIDLGMGTGRSYFLYFSDAPWTFNIDFFFSPRLMCKNCGLKYYPPVFGQYFLASFWCSTYNACFPLAGGFANFTPTGGSIQGTSFPH